LGGTALYAVNVDFSLVAASQWRQLNEFCQCVGWKLVFGLNLEKRDGLVWNSTNAEQLLNYTENKYKVNWELGNGK